MNRYEMPEVEVVRFDVEDVITLSVNLGENEAPFLPAAATTATKDEEFDVTE